MTLSRPRNSYFGKSSAGAGAATLAFFGRGLAFGAARLAEAARLAGRVGAGVGRFFDGCGFRAHARPPRLLMALFERR